MPNAIFATTHWSVVMRAGEADSVEGAAALEQLCRSYWYPVYAEIRRRGHAEHDAKDLTQEFFASLLRRGSLAAASPRINLAISSAAGIVWGGVKCACRRSRCLGLRRRPVTAGSGDIAHTGPPRRRVP